VAFAQQLLRHQGLPLQEGNDAGTFAWPCIEFTASADMQQSLNLKKRVCVLCYHFP